MSKELSQSQLRVLAVCLGNICRSPMAEAVMRAEATKMDIRLTVDSAVRIRVIDPFILYLSGLIGSSDMAAR